MIDNIKPKEVTSIVNSLVSGVVPKIGVQHITVGRSEEINAFISSLEDVKNGHSLAKFWIGDFGSGKSFMLHLLNTVALKQKFVVANADFTPENRIYSNDGKSVLLYAAIMDNIAIQTKPEGGALPTLLEKWIEQVITKVSEKQNIALTDIRNDEYLPLVQNAILRTVNEITEVGGFDFASVIIKYYEGYIKGDEYLRRNALKWLKGEYKTKTEARQDLGVREIINDANYYDMLKNFCKLFVSMGYSGFMINLDEAINLYKITTSAAREKNYEKILSIYNDCYQGKVSNFFVNFAGTGDFLENERRGLFSYQALKSRLEPNKFESLEIRDFAQPVIKLKPLNHNEIFVLLKKLKAIFDMNYKTELNVSDEDITSFMEEMFNKPGASEFLTPREVIRDFLNILNIIRQNPEIDKRKLFGEIEISDERPNDLVALDSIEEI
ncbi:ATP-binding protein [Soonwooa sp.]|uniref:ATP-binding protein n=1 Tax=Soonwooa sp. TaxID=1938592 RepID=UPI0026168B28|nr:ATP-binding protein [Soonwooa sp.]